MYKDRDKQREAVKQATRRYRAKQQGITPIVSQGITKRVSPMDRAVTPVIPSLPRCREVTEQPLRSGRRTVIEPLEPHTKDSDCSCHYKPILKPQSHNPMMVGYVPPKGGGL